MGNEIDVDLNRYNCTCIQGEEEGCFMDFFKEMKNSDPFNLMTSEGKSSKIELQENTPGGIHYPNDNMSKKNLKKDINKYKINLFEPENNIYNDNTNSFNNSIINDENEKEKDIKEFDKKTDYFLLANQINNAINELQMNLHNNNKNDKKSSNNMSDINTDKSINFQKAMKKAGKAADKIIFNNIINIIKKISDINSEVVLMKEKVYLGILNKFKKDKNEKYLINYEDVEKIIDLPNFEDIKEKNRLSLGDKFNNSKFKFNKFVIKGSFPNEILIWNLISQNTQKITKILADNYYCCLILLYYSKVEEGNETIMYLINKPTN